MEDGYRASSESWAGGPVAGLPAARHARSRPHCRRRRPRLLERTERGLPRHLPPRCWVHKRPTASTASRSRPSPRRRRSSGTAQRRDASTRPRPSPRSPNSTARSSPRPPRRASMTRQIYWRTATSRPSTGSPCGPRTRSSRPSPPSACGRRSPKRYGFAFVAVDGCDPDTEPGCELGVGVTAPQVRQGEQGLTCHGKPPPPRPDVSSPGRQRCGREPQDADGQVDRGRMDKHAKLLADTDDLRRDPVHQELRRCARRPNSPSAPPAEKGLPDRGVMWRKQFSGQSVPSRLLRRARFRACPS